MLAIAVSPWLLVVGAASIAAAWLYTGGPRPYGYAGYGELFVFVFFGLVAVVGTTYVISGELPAIAFVAAVPVGLLAVALWSRTTCATSSTDARVRQTTRSSCASATAGPGCFYVGLVVVALASSAVVAPWRHFALLGLLAAADRRETRCGGCGPAPPVRVSSPCSR